MNVRKPKQGDVEQHIQKKKKSTSFYLKEKQINSGDFIILGKLFLFTSELIF